MRKKEKRENDVSTEENATARPYAGSPTSCRKKPAAPAKGTEKKGSRKTGPVLYKEESKKNAEKTPACFVALSQAVEEEGCAQKRSLRK
jgi:hypothetical protein